MKVLYIGNVWLSLKLLEILVKNKIEIVGVVTTKQSKFNTDYKDLTNLCKNNKIDIHYTKSVNSKTTVSWIKNKHPDYIFCFGWSQILGKEILKIPKKYVVGFHPSQLPLFRGRHPIIWSIILGLKKTASTFFIINENIDDGPIINQKMIKINDNETSLNLYLKIIKKAKEQMKEILISIRKDNVKIVKNKKVNKTFLRKRSFVDGQIDWRMRAVDIDRLVRGLGAPYPGAHIIFKDNLYKIWEVKVVKNNQFIEPGKVISNKKNKPILKCADASIKIIKTEPKLFLKDNDYL